MGASKHVNVIRTGGIGILLCLALFVIGLADDKCDSDIRDLMSRDNAVAERAFNRLYSRGQSSFPCLMRMFGSKQSYSGPCGAQSASESFEVFIEHDGTFVGSIEPTEDAKRWVPRTEEVALYLIMAILAHDRYVADRCVVVDLADSPETADRRLQDALKSIVHSFNEQGGGEGRFDLHSVVSALHENELGFDGERTGGIR
jgi:hypothetical protein